MKLPKKSSFVFLSPAKINIFFLVLNKRSDNFHEIASLYQTISLFDVLTIEPAKYDHFSCSCKKLENSSNNVLEALQLFRKKFKINSKVKIHLEKKIPVEAGLGGGSSNAATTLWGLNKIFRKGNDEDTLIELSKQIGSDVPFFFSMGSAICTGKGEIVNNVNIPPLNGWILKPNFGISTVKVYQAIDSINTNQSYQQLLEDFKLNKPIFVNDLISPAIKVEPRILTIKQEYPEAYMTGSGSCFFTLKKPKINRLVEKIFPFKSVFRTVLGWYSINR